MSLISLTCKHCGANLETDDNATSFFCMYCGTKVMVEKQYIEHSGSITLNGIVSADSLLERAYIFISDGEFKRADEYLERVLDANPKSWKAYIGKLLCQNSVKSMESMTLSEEPLTRNGYFNRALEFSTGADRERLLSYNQVILDRIKAKKDAIQREIERKKREEENRIRRIHNEINVLGNEIEELNQFVVNTTGDYHKALAKGTPLIIVMVVEYFVLLIVLFFIIGFLVTYAEDGYQLVEVVIILFVFHIGLGIGGVIFLSFKKYKKVVAICRDYNKAKTEINGKRNRIEWLKKQL